MANNFQILIGLLNLIISGMYIQAVIYDLSEESHLVLDRAGYTFHRVFGGRFKYLTFLNTVSLRFLKIINP
jgi:hypothetical protein